jgi:XTP/dITP diphosphohydrolase
MPGDLQRAIVIATRNRDKETEIRAIFSGFPLPILGVSEFSSAPEVEETGATLEENAILKAESARTATGQISLADDSGLFVAALGGRPGVFSSRFAGEEATYSDNNAMLLDLMAGIPWEERGAQFVCTVAVALESGKCELFRGEVAGYITMESHGREGFGYDPLFFHPPSGKTFAELPTQEKNRISHRYLAFRAARQYLEKMFGR